MISTLASFGTLYSSRERRKNFIGLAGKLENASFVAY